MADTIEVTFAPVGLLVIPDRFISLILSYLILGKFLPPKVPQAGVQGLPLRREFGMSLFRCRLLDHFVDPYELGLERNKLLALPQLFLFLSWERLGKSRIQPHGCGAKSLGKIGTRLHPKVRRRTIDARHVAEIVVGKHVDVIL